MGFYPILKSERISLILLRFSVRFILPFIPLRIFLKLLSKRNGIILKDSTPRFKIKLFRFLVLSLKYLAVDLKP